jgi:Protein similar to CwfJ C-terminus 1
MIALGTRVYLSCTLHEELVPGHCLIVPIQHHLTTLEGDDDVWDEIRVSTSLSKLCRTVLTIASQNFMKSLMRMYAEDEKGVVFYETVTTLKWQRHSVIECVPVPWEQFDILPGYFKVCITGKPRPRI